MQRNPSLSIKTPGALSLLQAQDLKKEAVSDFYNLLHATLKKNDLINKPENMYNMDESSLPLNIRPRTVISELENRDCVASTNKERGKHNCDGML